MGLIGNLYYGFKAMWNYLAAGGTVEELKNAEHILKTKTAAIADAARHTPANVQLALAVETKFGNRYDEQLDSWAGFASALQTVCDRAAASIAAGKLVEGESDAFAMVRQHIENLSAWMGRQDPQLRTYLDKLAVPGPENAFRDVMPAEIHMGMAEMSDLSKLRLPTPNPGPQ